MAGHEALIAVQPSASAEAYLFETAAIIFDQPPHRLLLCAILASPALLCALPLTWLLMN